MSYRWRVKIIHTNFNENFQGQKILGTYRCRQEGNNELDLR
jgi:hypothetical protein